MSTSSESARQWRICSAASARQIPRPKIRQTFRRSNVLGGEPLARAGRGRTNAPVSDRSGNRGELGADEVRIPEVADTTSERMNAMMCSAVVNSIGLLLDIVGVVLLFRFGLPPDVTRTGARLLDLGSGRGGGA